MADVEARAQRLCTATLPQIAGASSGAEDIVAANVAANQLKLRGNLFTLVPRDLTLAIEMLARNFFVLA